MKKSVKWLLPLIFFVYLALPFIAGLLKIGNKWGPKIYPREFHQFAYGMMWIKTSSGSDKPRIGWWYKPENRPFFYGFYDKNEDPHFYKEMKEKKDREFEEDTKSGYEKEREKK